LWFVSAKQALSIVPEASRWRPHRCGSVLGLIFGDNHSLVSLEPAWDPKGNPNFKLRDLVNYALGK
jgi:hypothetical protein